MLMFSPKMLFSNSSAISYYSSAISSLTMKRRVNTKVDQTHFHYNIASLQSLQLF